jgi:hypothetical protein
MIALFKWLWIRSKGVAAVARGSAWSRDNKSYTPDVDLNSIRN